MTYIIRELYVGSILEDCMGLPTAGSVGTDLPEMEFAPSGNTGNQICARRWQLCAADRELETRCW